MSQNSDPLMFTSADWRLLDSLEVRNLSQLKGITDDMAKAIIREIFEGVNAGEGISKLSSRISKATGVSKNRATVIARTETINSATDAALLRFEQYGVTEFRYIAASDTRVCARCAANNGKVFKTTDLEHRPPIHPQCRCAVAPVVSRKQREDAIAAQKAKEAAEKEKLAKLKAEAEAKAKKEAEKAAAEKAKKEQELKEAKEKLKKQKEELEKLKEKLKNAPINKFDSSLRARVENPRVSYGAELKPVETPEFAIEPTRETINQVEYYYTTYDGHKVLNRTCIEENPKGLSTNMTKDEIIQKIHELDADLADKRLSAVIKLADGTELRPTGNVYRGMKGKTAEKISKLNVGDTFSHEGFSSYSLDQAKAEVFAGEGTMDEGARIVLIQEYRVGDVGHYIGTASEYSESEVLYPRGLIYKVVNKIFDKDTNRWKIWTEPVLKE